MNKTILKTEFQIRRALYEYNEVVADINKSRLYSYEDQIFIYESTSTGKKQLETDKINVMYQTEFLEETYKDFLYNKRGIDNTLQKINKWHKDIINNNQESIDWELVISSAKPDNLEEILKLHSEKMTDEIYWKTIAHCYVNSNMAHANSNIVDNYLKNKRPNKHFLMTEEERAFVNGLPEKITIYRGCSKKEIKSKKIRYSWTLKKSVAEFFAFEYINFIVEKSIDKDKSKYEVIERIIDKSEIYAYFSQD